MKRFVILAHDWPTPHYDFLLEAEGCLKAWRLATPPLPHTDQHVEAGSDHRLVYLDYEGPVSGGRGTVTRWDHGTYTGQLAPPPLTLQLAGARLRGLVRLEPQAGSTWRLRWQPDPADAPVA
ncbi:MAG TPA: DNA polymerase ligase N-terminal domain-containing protein [Gemmatales bacterium]|nr:DNA polymerase ligase N-terminal domain-containing protein [Gemmatales bacterium]